MDYSNLITRNSYEKIARGLGIVNVANLSFAALETIVQEATLRSREEYMRVRNDIPCSNILVDNGDANAAMGFETCSECGGSGYTQESSGNSPYDIAVECRSCEGEGLEMPAFEMKEAA